MSAADNRRAAIQHDAIVALAIRRGVTPDAVIDAMENGNNEVRMAVDAIVTAEANRLRRSNAMMGVQHDEEPASTEPVGLSGGAILWMIVLGVIAVLGLITLVARWLA